AFSQSLPVLMLAGFFGPASAGFYSLGRATLAMPTALLGKAISDVFYPHIAEAVHKDKNIYHPLLKTTLLLLLIGVVPFGIIILWGPILFELVFGHSWNQAGEYARWLSIWLLFGFVNRPVVSAIPV